MSLLTRVFKPGQLHQTILWVSAILCVLNFVVVILLAWLPCRPISAAWDVSITAKKCLDSWIYVKFCYYATSEPTIPRTLWKSLCLPLHRRLQVFPPSFLRRSRPLLRIVSGVCLPQAWMEYSEETGAIRGHGTWNLVCLPIQTSDLLDRGTQFTTAGQFSSATAVAVYKITTLKVLTFTDDFTCKTLVSYALTRSLRS